MLLMIILSNYRKPVFCFYIMILICSTLSSTADAAIEFVVAFFS